MDVKILRSSRRKLILRIIRHPYANLAAIGWAAIGYPALCLAAYLFFARIPLQFLDSTATSSFFIGFYFSAIIALATSRIIVFAIELLVRFYTFSWKIPRRVSKSSFVKRATEMNNKIASGEIREIDIIAFRSAARAIWHLEKGKLYFKIRADQSITRRFESEWAIFYQLVISVMIFTSIFSGSLAFNVTVIFLIFLFTFRFVWVGQSEQLEGLVQAAYYQVIAQRESLPAMFIDHVDVRKFRPVVQESFWNTIKRGPKEWWEFFIYMRKNPRMAVVVLAVSAVGLGLSKYYEDLSTKVLARTEALPVDCISPLLNGSAYAIVFSHTQNMIGIIPFSDVTFHVLQTQSEQATGNSCAISK